MLKLKKKSSFEIRLRLQSYDLNCLKNFEESLKEFILTKALIFKSISLPIKIQKFTLLKSPHVNKKAKEQYEIRFYNRLVIIKGCTLSWDFLKRVKSFNHQSISMKICFLS